MSSPLSRYPEIEVELVDHDADPRAILGTVTEALKAGGVPPEERLRFFQEATKDDRDHLLRTVTEWVTVT